MNCLGIDMGTQSVKLVITTSAGEILGEASSCYQPHIMGEGRAEQDASVWTRALASAYPLALQAANLRAADIGAIGVAAQLDGCLAVDKDNTPLSPCMIWMDRRASLPALPSDFRQRTGLVADASHMAAKIRHMLLDGTGAARFHQPTSYLVEELCGAVCMDHALASTTMLYNLEARAYDAELLHCFGVDGSMLPAIAKAQSVAGTVSEAAAKAYGLPLGIPVAVGTGDDFATALGAGVCEPGVLLCILGTAEVVGTISERPVIDEQGLVETHGFLDDYFIENPGWLSGGAVVWCRALLGVEDDAAFDRLAAQAPIGCDGLSFIPALSGAMAPLWHPNAKACFYGLDAHHGPAHMARAVLEGCAFAMRDVRDRMLQLGLRADEIVLLGGGASSELWAQMRADLCQVPVHAQAQSHACALGASLLARACAFPNADIRQLAGQVVAPRQRFAPRGAHAAAYQEAYEKYRRLFAALTPLF